MSEYYDWTESLPEHIRSAFDIRQRELANSLIQDVKDMNMSAESELAYLASKLAQYMIMTDESMLAQVQREHQGMVGEAEPLFDLRNGRSCGDE